MRATMQGGLVDVSVLRLASIGDVRQPPSALLASASATMIMD